MIEKSDMREDCAETIVGVREILLQGKRPPQFGDGFEVLEVLRRSPQQESVGNVSLGQIGVDFECPAAVKLRLFEPCAGWIELEVTSRGDKGKSGMSEREIRIS